MVTIRAPRVVVPGGVLQDATVAMDAGRIVAVITEADTAVDITLPSGVLCPGFVDAQVNGYYGVDFVRATAPEWSEVTDRLPETGVTALVPTFITAPVELLAKALREATRIIATLDGGARVLGVHLEGPFLSEQRRGAHDAAHLRDPSPRDIETLLEAASGHLAMVTLAPERAGARDAVRRLTEAGVLVSVGHSDATAEQVGSAADAGARMVTHLYNAQRPLHHREAGVTGRGLTDPRLTCGLIVDLHHVNAAAVLVAFAAAPGRIALVTDAAASAGMPPGRYDLGGQPVIMQKGQPPLRADGTIAGSGLRMDDAVANAVAVGVDLFTAVSAATRVPADLLGRSDLGRIEVGALADLVWLGEDLRARSTWLDGHLVHGSERVTA